MNKLSTRAFVLLTFILISSLAHGQLNADVEWIREHKIKTAYLPYKYSAGGWVLEYDQQGRLQKTLQVTWVESEHTGWHNIHRYDSLGRPTLYAHGKITDSINRFTCEPVYYEQKHDYAYPSDSVVIQCDSQWNEKHQLSRTYQTTTTTRWKKIEPPQGRRPVYWPDSLIDHYLYQQTLTYYRYTDSSSSPQLITRVQKSWMTYTMENGNIRKRGESHTYYGDTVETSSSEETYTLHHRKDTVRTKWSSEKRLISDDKKILEQRSGKYREVTRSRKFPGYYFVRYYTYLDKFTICRTPWTHPGLALLYEHWTCEQHTTGENMLIHFQGDSHGIPPQFTYWP